MQIQKYLLLVLFISCTQFLFSQGVFQKGFIVTSENDTLRGEVSFDKSESSLQYRTSSNEAVQTFKPEEVLSIATTGNRDRTYRYIDVDVASRKVDRLNERKEPELKKRWLNLQLIASGYVNLFHVSLYGREHDHFFIEKKDGSLEELVYTLYIKPEEIHGTIERHIIENEQYKVQLSLLMGDCPEAFDLIDKTKYNLKSMKRLFHVYNTCNGQVEKFIPLTPKANKGTLGILAGVAITELAFSQPLILNVPVRAQFGNSYSPVIGGSVDIYPLFKSRHISLYNDVTFSQMKGELNYIYTFSPGRYKEIDFSYNSTYLRASSMLHFQLFFGQIKPFISAGGSLGSPIIYNSTLRTQSVTFSTNDDVTQYDVLQPNLVEVTVLVGAGASMGPITFQVRMGIGTGTSSISSSTQTYGMLGYEF